MMSKNIWLTFKIYQTITYCKFVLISSFAFLFLNQSYSINAQDITVKIKNKLVIDTTTAQRDSSLVGSVTVSSSEHTHLPCGDRIGISLEDDRFYFCKESSMMSTVSPGDTDGSVVLPDGTVIHGTAGKTETPPTQGSIDEISYDNVLARINSIRPGVYVSNDEYRWSIVSEDLESYYPQNTHDVVLEGENRIAFNSEALFYEMLVSIQKLSQENAELKLRLDIVENKTGITSEVLSTENYIKIVTNPIDVKNLELEYRLSGNIAKANLLITTVTGKVVKSSLIEERGIGNKAINLDVPSGLYLCNLVIDNNVIESHKFIVP